MPARLTHEQLEVYRLAISFVAQSGDWADSMKGNFSVRDQLIRAAESVPINIAASNTHQGVASQTQSLDVAAGSIAECAAALDVMRAWRLLPETRHAEGQAALIRIYRMTMGLSRSKVAGLREESPEAGEVSFPHERLECYRASLSLVEWLSGLEPFPDLPPRCRDILDRTSTALVLNLAEGNARRHPKDKARFISISLTAALRCAAQLDIAEARRWLDQQLVEQGKTWIASAVPQLAGLKRYWLE